MEDSVSNAARVVGRMGLEEDGAHSSEFRVYESAGNIPDRRQ